MAPAGSVGRCEGRGTTGRRPCKPGGTDTGDGRRNLNIHQHRAVLDAVRPGAARALDIGCGEGVLSRRPAERVPHVTGIGRDGPSIESARRGGGGEGVEYIRGDFLTTPWEPASYDVVTSVAALHRVHAAAGLERMAELLRPGGTLAVVGLARNRRPGDLALDVLGMAGKRLLRLRRTTGSTRPPWSGRRRRATRACAASRRERCPGCRYRHGTLSRYTLTWVKAGPEGKTGRPTRRADFHGTECQFHQRL